MGQDGPIASGQDGLGSILPRSYGSDLPQPIALGFTSLQPKMDVSSLKAAVNAGDIQNDPSK